MNRQVPGPTGHPRTSNLCPLRKTRPIWYLSAPGAVTRCIRQGGNSPCELPLANTQSAPTDTHSTSPTQEGPHLWPVPAGADQAAHLADGDVHFDDGTNAVVDTVNLANRFHTFLNCALLCDHIDGTHDPAEIASIAFDSSQPANAWPHPPSKSQRDRYPPPRTAHKGRCAEESIP
jgi:hypothetical protein